MPDNSHHPEISKIPHSEIPILESQDLVKIYSDHIVLDKVSFTANRGDVIALLGQSGSGKSTILRCINFLAVPDEGDIIFHGERIKTKVTRKGERVAASSEQILQLRNQISMVFQSFNLWQHKTILQNVMEAPLHVQKRSKDEVERVAIALLEKVGIRDKKDHFPHALSGGQQQRAAIARALAMNPEVILFDEPTSALDPEMVGEVLGVIKALANEGKTMIVATHEMGFAREVANKAVFLSRGKIIEQGSTQELFSRPKSPELTQFLSAAFD